MTAAELASLLHARKVGKGKWVARCVAHPDRTPSLSIAEGKKVPVVLRCMSQGCETGAILEALGLHWSDVFYGKPTPELRVRLSLEEHRDSLERQLGLVTMLEAMEKDRRRYWEGAERRIRGELDQLRCRLEPAVVIQECRKRWLARVGFERAWEAVYGVHRAGSGPRQSAGSGAPVGSRDRVYSGSHKLPDGGVLARPADAARP